MWLSPIKTILWLLERGCFVLLRMFIEALRMFMRWVVESLDESKLFWLIFGPELMLVMPFTMLGMRLGESSLFS